MRLDNAQQRIVNSTAKNIVVVAGAGSGKTAVLTQRIRQLIEDRDVKPSEITAITFTNMAADELKERLSDIDRVEDMFVGTIHSFANRILKNDGKYYKLLTDEMYAILIKELIGAYCTHLTVDRFEEYENMVKEYNNGSRKITREAILCYFEDNEQFEYNMLIRKYVPPEERTYPESVYTLCKKRGIITFDELIIKAKTSVEHSEKIKYLFVDEYQDVGNLEDSFIRSLEAENNFIVGDDWQSIYGFKGANVKIFKEYVKSPDWKCYHLDNNYRNSGDIVSFAENVINDVSDKLPKQVVVKNRGKGTVQVSEMKNLEEFIKKIKERKNYGEWFFLTRTRKDLNFILELCNKIGLPAITFSKGDLSLEEMRLIMKQDKVKVLTVHAAKGLETENVLLYGNFPAKLKPLNADRYNEKKIQQRYEERRIMYVGATRAKTNLIVLN